MRRVVTIGVDEIETTTKKMKNGRAAGIGEARVEILVVADRI